MSKKKKKPDSGKEKEVPGLTGRLRMHPFMAGLILLLVTCVIYADSLDGRFVFDDTVIIQGNQAIQGLDGMHLKQIFGGHYWQAVESRGGLYRPIVMFSYALNYALGGEDPQGYHLVNLLLHAANGILVYFVLQLLFARPELSFLSALLFVLHPIRTEGVASVVGRAESLSAFFMLLAWLIYLKGRTRLKPGLVWLSAAVFILAALSKESALPFVALLPLSDYIIHRREGKRRWFDRAMILRYLPFAIALFVVAGLRYWVLGGIAPLYVNPESNPLAKAGAWTRFLTATNVFARYLALLVFPWNLSADYSFNQIPPVNTLVSWSAPGPLLLLLLVIGGVVLAARNRPVFFFSGIFFFAAFSLSSNWFRPIGTIMAERLMYFPALGFSLATAYLILEGLGRTRWKGVAAVTAVVLVAGYGLRTIVRNRDWRSNYALFRSTARTSPGSGLAQSNCALVLLKANDVRGAAEHARLAIAIQPDSPTAQFTLGSASRRLGNLPEAARAFEKVVELAPHSSGGTEALQQLAQTHEAMGELLLAEADYRKLIDWFPSNPKPYLGLSRIYRKMGDEDRAAEASRKAAQLK